MSDQHEPAWTNRLNSCKHHGDDHEACAVYGGRVPCDAESEESVAEVVSIDPMRYTAVVKWMPDQNGVIPKEIDRIGNKLYTHPPAAKVPEGWKLVPCHADKAMIRIGKRAQKEEFLFRQDPDLNIQQIWKAMIAFAPSPTEQESE